MIAREDVVDDELDLFASARAAAATRSFKFAMVLWTLFVVSRNSNNYKKKNIEFTNQDHIE